MTGSGHRWQFSRLGGFDQARFETAADLAELENLDLKLWAALACPVKGLEFDERTLALIDTDGDGRVRAPEVINAVQWCEDHLKDLGALKSGGDTLPLARINDQTDSGKAILASAKQILKDLGKPAADSISLDDVADTAKIFAETRFNGDGVIPADAAADEPTKQVLLDVMECLGSRPDRSGKPGVDQDRVDAFFVDVAKLDAWAARLAAEPALRPLGGETTAAADAWRAVRAKVDDYFTRCRLAAFDPRVTAAVNRTEEDYLAAVAKDMSVTAQEVAGFPLARVEAGRPLPLAAGLNPAWSAGIAALASSVVTPLVGPGRSTLSESEWTSIRAKFAAHEAWLAEKPSTAVEKLGLARVREIHALGAKPAVDALLAQDKALEKEAAAIVQVETLVRYHRDLYRLLHNFVNFADFYTPGRKATFQAGTLYLDARACSLCVRVDDAGKHAALAGFAKAYLAYCDCSRPSGEKMTIAAAFTGGDSDYLMVGRNGIFYDRKGRDWDATVTRVVENPISVRQAFWSPYKKFVRMIEEFAAKRAAASQAESDARMAAAAETTAHVEKAKPPEPKKIDVGTVAAIGVAVGAIGTFAAAIFGQVTGLFKLEFWIICLVVVGVIFAISGPSMLIAWLKLRQRNLGPILDANGWAVNGRVKMNVRFGGSLTDTAKLPPGALPSADPFGEKPSRWPKVLVAIVIVTFVYSFLADENHGWLYSWTKPGTAFHDAVGFPLGHEYVTEEQKEARKALEVARVKAAEEKAKADVEAAKAKADADAKAKADAKAESEKPK
jgi:hypothetical protein